MYVIFKILAKHLVKTLAACKNLANKNVCYVQNIGPYNFIFKMLAKNLVKTSAKNLANKKWSRV